MTLGWVARSAAMYVNTAMCNEQGVGDGAKPETYD